MNERRRIAVIGSGVAGLTAAHVLARGSHVTLFEADNRLGGHAHTHRIPLESGAIVNVDTGFIVHNDRTYPTLQRLFDDLAVATQESDMSMSVRSAASGLEYAGARGVRGLFPTARNIARPRYLRMLLEVTRFHRAARAVLAKSDAEHGGETLRDFLARHQFSRYFEDNFLTPLVAAVWSCDPTTAPLYPARYLFTFLEHHGMLSVFGSPTWRTVTGGSARYVEKVAAGLDEILTGTPVRHIRRTPTGVRVVADGVDREFDGAVIALHPRQALEVLADANVYETQVLGDIPYSHNHALLHTDESLLPRAAGARASWNYLIPDTGESDGVIVTYDMTRLMSLDTGSDRRFLVTLGGGNLVDPATVLAEMDYEHPIFTPQSVAAQARLADLNSDTIAFAGAYHGWGFHEDGALSGLRAAECLGGAWDRPVLGRRGT